LNSLSALETNIIGGRTFLGNRTNITNNLWAGGPAPYGYYLKPSPNINHKNKSILVINPFEKPIVKKIFQLYTLGYSHKDISNFIKVEYPYNKDRLWSINSIKSILNNPIYKGIIVWNKKGGSRHPSKKDENEYIKSQYMESLRIINDETWNKAKQIRQLQNNNPKFLSTQFLLRDIIYCMECGSNLHCKNHGNSSGSVYMCNNKDCSKSFNIKSNTLHEIMFNEMLSIFSSALSDENFFDKFYLNYTNNFLVKQKSLIKEKQDLELLLYKTNNFILKSKNKLESLHNNTQVDSTNSQEYDSYICVVESLKEHQIHLELAKNDLNTKINFLNEQLNSSLIEKDSLKNIFSTKITKFDEIIKIKDLKLKNRCLRLFIYETIDRVLIDSDRNIEVVFK